MADDREKTTVPHPDEEFAKKGASLPAPLPEDERPDKEKEMKKARAMLEGRDPAVAELVDEVKGSGGLIEVAKDGETLRVNPDTLDAHLAAGWRIVDADRADARKPADKPKSK